MIVKSNYMELQVRTVAETQRAFYIGGFWRQSWLSKRLRWWWTNRNVLKIHFLEMTIEDDYRHLMEYRARKKKNKGE